MQTCGHRHPPAALPAGKGSLRSRVRLDLASVTVRGVLTKMYKVGMAFSNILWVTANMRIQILLKNMTGYKDMIIQALIFLYEIRLMILVRLIKMCLNETYSRVW